MRQGVCLTIVTKFSRQNPAEEGKGKVGKESQGKNNRKIIYEALSFISFMVKSGFPMTWRREIQRISFAAQHFIAKVRHRKSTIKVFSSK